MDEMTDPVFGRLMFDGFWSKPYVISLFEAEVELGVRIQCGRDEEIESSQRMAFEQFEANKERIIGEAENAILDYYRETAPIYREMFGETDSGRRVPPVEVVVDLRDVLTPLYLWFPWNFTENELNVGIVFDCTWDPGHGLAVKIVNGEVAEVGSQDIVL